MGERLFLCTLCSMVDQLLAVRGTCVGINWVERFLVSVKSERGTAYRNKRLVYRRKQKIRWLKRWTGVRRGVQRVQLVLLGGGFPDGKNAASEDMTSRHAQNMQLHEAVDYIDSLLYLDGVVLRYLGWSRWGNAFRNRIGRFATDQRSTSRTISPMTTQYSLRNNSGGWKPIVNQLSKDSALL
jgi:hypothetical protein